MGIDFANVTGITIPEGAVSVIANGGEAVWRRKIPSGYTEYDYLQSSSTQYINTGFIPDQDSKMEVVYRIVTTGSFCFAGCRTLGEGKYFTANTGGGGTRLYASFAGTVNYDVGTVVAGEKHHCKISREGIYLDRVLKTVPTSGSSWTGDYPVVLFGVHQGSVALLSTVKMYSCILWDNSTIAHYYVPAVRDSDSVAGMYDIVANTFKTNEGTGTFTAGNET